MSKFVDIARESKKEKINIFMNYLFNELHKDDDIFKYLKKLNEKDVKLFYNKMPEKWWKENFSKYDIINEEEEKRIEEELITFFGEFEKNFDKLNLENLNQTKSYRKILKAGFEDCGTYSDYTKGYDYPSIEKPFNKDDDTLIDLPKPDANVVLKKDIFQCMKDRKSRRKFKKEELSIDELSYLLWATQGVTGIYHNDKVTTRTVPSGGARQPFETYLAINYVNGIKPGVYRYLPIQHKLIFLFSDNNLIDNLSDYAREQDFAGNCAVCFIWSTIPYRCEYMYTTEAKKIIAQDSGHLCQNLYLAAESINCGTCAIGAYDQKKMDSFLKLDGEDEFVIYMSPVGKV